MKAIIPLAPPLLTGSSNLPGRANGPFDQRPYLVLLHAGFGLPRLLPAARWAFTPPFHPFPGCPGWFVFCATFRRVAPPGCYPAHCPMEFGLSSPASTSLGSLSTLRSRPRMVADGSDYPAHCSINRLSGQQAGRLAVIPVSRPTPAKSDTAPASCTNYYAAYR